MSVILKIITGIAVIFIVLLYWSYIGKKFKQYFGRPDRDELPAESDDIKELRELSKNENE